MNRFLFSLATCAGSLALPASALAAYNPAVVSADARWVVHADLNLLRDTVLGQELIAAIEAAQKDATGGMFGLNIPKLVATIGTLTAYGTNFVPDPKLVDGALVAQGTADLRKIAESILLQGTLAEPNVFSEVTDLGFPAYAIADPQAVAADKTQVVVAFPPEPVVLVSKSRTQLLKAREVFRGTAPSIAKSSTSPLAKLPPKAQGAYLFSASEVPSERDLKLAENAPQTRILQLTKSAAFAVGQRNNDTFAHAELLASSDANAERLLKILQGLTAMLGLAETNDKQLAEFLRSVDVSREKNTVTLDLAYSSARLAGMVRNLRAEPASRRRQPAVTSGRTVAEWGGDHVTVATGGQPTTRTIENVKLFNGATISLGRLSNGAQGTRFNSLEIVPAEGGAPLTFRPDFMRIVRGTMLQLPFPGADGVYTLRVNYTPDAEGKAKFAVSVSDPKPAGEEQRK